MKCPNNDECEIQFYSEENDSGDGVWFQSWTVYLYDAENSYHVPECPPLTEQQIEVLEDEYNKEPDYPEPIIFDDMTFTGD